MKSKIRKQDSWANVVEFRTPKEEKKKKDITLVPHASSRTWEGNQSIPSSKPTSPSSCIAAMDREKEKKPLLYIAVYSLIYSETVETWQAFKASTWVSQCNKLDNLRGVSGWVSAVFYVHITHYAPQTTRAFCMKLSATTQL